MMICCSTLHDPEGRMCQLAKERLVGVMSLFSGLVVAKTEESHKDYERIFPQNKLISIKGGSYADGRRETMRVASGTNEEQIANIEFDKLLHWIKINPSELKKISSLKPKGFLILGRSKQVWETYPRSWKDTEGIVNLLANKRYRKRDWDWFAGPAIMSKQVAKLLVEKSTEDSWAVIFDYVDLVVKNKFKLEYQTCEGSVWEDPDRFQGEIKRLGKAKWERENYDGLKEWSKRVSILYQMANYFSKVKLAAAPKT